MTDTYSESEIISNVEIYAEACGLLLNQGEGICFVTKNQMFVVYHDFSGMIRATEPPGDVVARFNLHHGMKLKMELTGEGGVINIVDKDAWDTGQVLHLH